jgi:low temperature requirement protein LtrA
VSETTAGQTEETEREVRVSTLELFFDLVFVFTATQLTAKLAKSLTVVTVLQVLLLLGVILWMYLGFAWLTNAVAPTASRLRRTLILVAMGGFLSIALAIPDAFGSAGWVFGLAYFLINAIHSALFALYGGVGGLRGILSLAPTNLTSATLVLVGGFLPGWWRYGMWTAAVVIQLASPYVSSIGNFEIRPAHFVERHGLIVIVALGESIVAIGVGAGDLPVDIGLIVVAVLGLMLSYFMYWVYFAGDDELAIEALTRAHGRRRALMAVQAYGYAHYALLFGIVVIAAGIKGAIGHAWDPLTLAQSLTLAGGLTVFLAGDVAFRKILGIVGVRYRTIGAVAMLATVPLGLVAAVTQMTALIVLTIVMLFLELRYETGVLRLPASG